MTKNGILATVETHTVNQTGVKTSGVIYQNDGYERLVIVNVAITCAPATSDQYDAYVEAATPPTVVQGTVGSSATGILLATLIFTVPPNQYYEVIETPAGAAIGAINSWFEKDFN